MQDHALFQAICHVNRLDTDDKDFGYIVDYKDLFKRAENAIAVYTSELDHSSRGADPEVVLQDRLKKGPERLDTVLETTAVLCDPVAPPQGELEFIHYFCGNTKSQRIWRNASRSASRRTRRIGRTRLFLTNWSRRGAVRPMSPVARNGSIITCKCAKSSMRARPRTASGATP